MKIYLITIFLLILSAICQFTKQDQQLSVERQILTNFMEAEPKELFKVFHFLFKKEYNINSEIALKKYRVFKDNVNKIKEHNSKGLSWWEAVNEFSDLTNEEFVELFNLKPKTEEEMRKFFQAEGRFLSVNFDEDADKDDVAPQPEQSDVNWISAFGQPRHQGGCGSCWAFSTMGTVEAAYAIRNRQVTPYLSTQQLVDCDMNGHGCSGGWMHNALNYLRDAGGAMTDADYPYTQVKGTCRFNRNNAKYQVRGFDGCDSSPYWFMQGKPCTEQTWRALLARNPVAVVLSSAEAFRNYGGGVINTQGMPCTTLDHAVVAYAWTTQSGRGVISVRNSWGNNWGDKGNFHIYYTDQSNSTCWITKIGFIPVL